MFMTYAIQELVIRDVAPVDPAEITSVLAAAMWDGPVARWLTPDATLRRDNSPAYFEIFAEHAVRFGEVYATVDPDSGKLAGVALWFPFTAYIPPPVDYERRLKDASASAFDRACELDAAMGRGIPPRPITTSRSSRCAPSTRTTGSAALCSTGITRDSTPRASRPISRPTIHATVTSTSGTVTSPSHR
jgi:hypothetical protein